MNTALNVTCDFKGYLVCQIPDNMVEVELKIKTTRGKYTLIKDAHIRMEKYCAWDRADRRVQVHSKRRRTPRREVTTRDTTVDNTTSSETDIPNGEGFGYPPRVFTDPEYVNTLPLTENDSEPEVT